MKFSTVNPATDKKLSDYEYITSDQLEAVIEKAHQGFLEWKNKSLTDRQGLLKKLAQNLGKRRDELARMMAQEMGKPISDATAEIKKCEATAVYYSEIELSSLQLHEIKTSFKKSYVAPCPTGIIFGIMPWNFPIWQIMRFTVPTLLLGNVVLVKPSDQTAGSSLILDEVFAQTFGNIQLFKILLLQNELAPSVISDRRVTGVSFTGSTKTGRLIASQAGQAIKKTVLELGGSDASLILPDADLAKAAQLCVKSRLQNNGQSCVSSKRFFVHRPQLDTFLTHFTKAIETFQVGDPLDIETKLGPLAQKKFKESFEEEWEHLAPFFERSWKMEGEIFSKGAYFAPRWAVMKEHSPRTISVEMFCPAAQIFPYDTIEQAVQMLNSSDYGLGASIYAGDIEKAQTLAVNSIDSGMVTINDLVRSDPALPFGGVKDSGYGRELSSHGIFEFCNFKSVGIS
ncbi:MAG: aldehyde dehydrogenase family protein [Bdellovibrionota bacterium]